MIDKKLKEDVLNLFKTNPQAIVEIVELVGNYSVDYINRVAEHCYLSISNKLVVYKTPGFGVDAYIWTKKQMIDVKKECELLINFI